METLILRVHEYGGCCEVYPCEKCGFRGTDIDFIHSHIETFHGSSEETTNHITLDDTAIEAQPVCFKRISKILVALSWTIRET